MTQPHPLDVKSIDEANLRLKLHIVNSLKSCIEDCGFSQVEIAEQLGISESSLSQSLSGRGNVSIKRIASIAFVAGMQMRVRFIPTTIEENDWATKRTSQKD